MRQPTGVPSSRCPSSCNSAAVTCEQATGQQQPPIKAALAFALLSYGAIGQWRFWQSAWAVLSFHTITQIGDGCSRLTVIGPQCLGAMLLAGKVASFRDLSPPPPLAAPTPLPRNITTRKFPTCCCAGEIAISRGGQQSGCAELIGRVHLACLSGRKQTQPRPLSPMGRRARTEAKAAASAKAAAAATPAPAAAAAAAAAAAIGATGAAGATGAGEGLAGPGGSPALAAAPVAAAVAAAAGPVGADSTRDGSGAAVVAAAAASAAAASAVAAAAAATAKSGQPKRVPKRQRQAVRASQRPIGASRSPYGGGSKGVAGQQRYKLRKSDWVPPPPPPCHSKLLPQPKPVKNMC